MIFGPIGINARKGEEKGLFISSPWWIIQASSYHSIICASHSETMVSVETVSIVPEFFAPGVRLQRFHYGPTILMLYVVLLSFGRDRNKECQGVACCRKLIRRTPRCFWKVFCSTAMWPSSFHGVAFLRFKLLNLYTLNILIFLLFFLVVSLCTPASNSYEHCPRFTVHLCY